MGHVVRRLAPLVLSAAASLAGGCVVAAVAVGAAAAFGTVKYTENEAYRDFHAPLDATWKATIAALREEGYPVADSASHGPSEGKIEIDDAKVTVVREPGDATRVMVRIGTFSTDEHKRRAALILDGVAKRVE
jgi:hypothetical protein